MDCNAEVRVPIVPRKGEQCAMPLGSPQPGPQPAPSQSGGLDAEQEAAEQRERDLQEALDRLRHPPAQSRETAGRFGHAQKSGHLDLFRECVGVEGATQLASSLRCDTALQQLGLAEAGIGDAGATPLAAALLENCTLTALNLSYNCIGDAGAKRLANALQGNSALTHLGLEGNHVTDKGLIELATAVASNCALGHLDLKLNAVRGAAGATILAATLKDNTTLKSLSLASNELGDAGVAVVAEALKENVGLTRLELAGRDAGIGDACATAVADALGANKTLVHMSLKFHRIGDNDKGEEAAAALRASPVLTEQSQKSLEQACIYGAEERFKRECSDARAQMLAKTREQRLKGLMARSEYRKKQLLYSVLSRWQTFTLRQRKFDVIERARARIPKAPPARTPLGTRKAELRAKLAALQKVQDSTAGKLPPPKPSVLFRQEVAGGESGGGQRREEDASFNDDGALSSFIDNFEHLVKFTEKKYPRSFEVRPRQPGRK